MRTRNASNGSLVYSVLQPHRSGGANQTIYSGDGVFLAVHNSSGGLGYRVHRAADGFFLGNLTVTVDANGVVRFAPDAQGVREVEIPPVLPTADVLPVWAQALGLARAFWARVLDDGEISRGFAKIARAAMP